MCKIIISFIYYRSGIDARGILNDTIRIVFEQFIEYKNIEQIEGNGKVFTGGIKKLINPHLLIKFSDYLHVSNLKKKF